MIRIKGAYGSKNGTYAEVANPGSPKILHVFGVVVADARGSGNLRESKFCFF